MCVFDKEFLKCLMPYNLNFLLLSLFFRKHTHKILFPHSFMVVRAIKDPVSSCTCTLYNFFYIP